MRVHWYGVKWLGCMLLCGFAFSANAHLVGSNMVVDVDFDKTPLGLYTAQDLAHDWKAPRWSRGIKDGRVSIFAGKGAYKGHSLRVLYTLGSVGMRDGGAGWRTPIAASEIMYMSYKIKFREGFQFVRGGKLPGLGGGRANTGGHRPTGDGWSVRYMWEKNAHISAYVYHMDQPTKYGEHFFFKDTTLQTGRWYRLKMKVTMNTVGKRDGSLLCWIDGKLVVNEDGLRFRTRQSVKIDEVLFETFFGGGSPSYAALRNEYIDFDEFKVWNGGNETRH